MYFSKVGLAIAIALSIPSGALSDPPSLNPDLVPEVSPERPPTWDDADLGGQVIDSSGAVVPGATVMIEGPLSQGGRRVSTKSTKTEMRGEFKFRGLLPGKYNVAASIQGISRVSMTVELSPSRGTVLTLTLPGRVPVVELRQLSPIPQPEPPAREVLEKKLDDELAAQAWVNSLSAKGERIVAVISLGPARSIFVLQQEKAAPNYTVIRAERTLDAANLSKLLDVYGARSLVGVHALDKAFLMIFSP